VGRSLKKKKGGKEIANESDGGEKEATTGSGKRDSNCKQSREEAANRSDYEGEAQSTARAREVGG